MKKGDRIKVKYYVFGCCDEIEGNFVEFDDRGKLLVEMDSGK